MKYAPVIIFVYNRADHFLKTYNALKSCEEAEFSDLYIYSDGAKNEDAIQKVNEVRACVNSIKNTNDFKSVTVVEGSENKGLAKSIIDGVTVVIHKYGKAIVVEDDCSVSPYFLKYMNSALDFYEDNKRIGSISGYCPPVDMSECGCGDVFVTYRSCSWTWATWADRWQNVDWDLKDISDFYKSPMLIKKLNSNGNDRFLRLYRQTKGNGSSWSVRFGAHLVKNDLLTVYPKYSYNQNIGCDDSGIHSSSDDNTKMAVDLSKSIADPVFTDLSIDKKIQKMFKNHYSYGVISNIKKFIATVFIVIKERIKG